MKEISIIIVTWNSEEYIEDCLTAIKKGESPTRPYEIIIVDNASQDKTVECVEKWCQEETPYTTETSDITKKKKSNIQIIENLSNLGLSKAINQGVRASHKLAPTSKYILLLNPDVVASENAISELYQFMEQREDVGACGPRFWTPSGKPQPSCRELPSFKNLFTEFTGLARLTKCSSWKMWYFNHSELREVDQPMGSCLLISKKVFDEIGGMNPRYPIFMNDVDLCERIKKAGYKIYFVPSANMNHYLGGSTRKVRRKMILEEHWSMYHYLRDHFKNRFLVTLYAFLLLMSAFYRILFSFFMRN